MSTLSEEYLEVTEEQTSLIAALFMGIAIGIAITTFCYTMQENKFYREKFQEEYKAEQLSDMQHFSVLGH